MHSNDPGLVDGAGRAPDGPAPDRPSRPSGLRRAVRRALWPWLQPYRFVAQDLGFAPSLRRTERRAEALAQETSALSRSVEERLAALAQAVEHAARRGDERADASSAELAGLARHTQQRAQEIAAELAAEIAAERRRNEVFREEIGAKRFERESDLSALRAEIIAVSRQFDEFRSLSVRLEAGLAQMRRVQENASRALSAEHQASVARLDHAEQRVADLTRAAAEQQTAQQAAAALAERLAQGIGQSIERAVQAPPLQPSQPLGAEAVLVQTGVGPLLLKAGDLITEHVVRHGAWDAHLVPVIHRAARRGQAAIDAGAHFGVVSAMMAQEFRRVHAFEPNRSTFLFLCANATLRPLGTIVPYNLALYSGETRLSLAKPQDQEVPIPDGAEAEAGYRQIPNVGSLKFSETGSGVNLVEARTLDSFGFEDVGLLKVDCQGSDGAVLLGAMQTIRRCQPVVVFEWEDELSRSVGVAFDDVLHRFQEAGYTVEKLHVHNAKQIDYIAHPER